MREQHGDNGLEIWRENEMAYGIVPHKGEPTMCEQPCDHKDCKLWREFFVSKCEICGKTFEEGQRYYQTEPRRKLKDERRWVHAACEEERIEKENN